MNFQQFILILRARWLLMVSVAGVVVAAAVVVSLLLPKQYTASVSIVVDAKAVDPITGIPVQAMLIPSFMATQVDIITSDRVATRVIKSLKLDQVPQFREQWQESTQGRGSFNKWLGDTIVKKLDVKPSRESNVLNLDFTWPDASASALLANAFAQAYLDTTVELRVEPAKQYASFFTERTKIAREELETAQKKLSDFQRENGIIATDERLDVETNRLNELSSQLVAIQSLRMDSASRQTQASNKESMAEVLQNPLVSGLKSDLARLETRRDELSKRLGKNHPEYLRTESEIIATKEKVEAEIAKVVSSIGTSNRVNVQRESDLRNALENQKKKVLELKQQRDEVAVLQNDVNNAQRNFDTITQRLTQTSLESQTQQTNVAILNSAVEPIVHSSPKTLRNLLIAIFLGTLLGVGTALLLELLDKRVRGAQDMQELLGLPVLGVVHHADALPGRRGNLIQRLLRRGKPKLKVA